MRGHIKRVKIEFQEFALVQEFNKELTDRKDKSIHLNIVGFQIVERTNRIVFICPWHMLRTKFQLRKNEKYNVKP